MKLLYATSIQYPSPYANRIQILSTSQALSERLGARFVLAGNHFGANDLYRGRTLESHSRFGPKLVWQQLSLIRREGFDTIFSRETNLLFLHMLFNTLWFHLPLRYVLEMHTIELSWRARFVLARAHHVFCITRPLLEDLQVEIPDLQGSVLADAVDVARFVPTESKEEARMRLGVPLDAYLVLYVGDTDAWKGVGTLYEAAAHLPTPYLVTLIGGREWQKEEIAKIYPKVRFLGPSPYELLPNNMRAADVLVLPNTAREAISARHTSPLKLFAYMTSGVPIVASDLLSLRDVLNDTNAFLVEPDDAEDLAKGIRTLAMNADLGKALAEQARQDVATHTWSSRAERIIAAIT
jgi:glycosyltransferase involved in cell wall biosynthesis